MRRPLAAVICLSSATLALAIQPAHAAPIATSGTARTATPKHATAIGYGGAVTSVDADATQAGLSVLKQGGNAVDAAIATAAALGVTEPHSAGIGGGGYLMYYDARTRQVHTIDGRETAPLHITHDAFVNPKTGQPYTFTPDLVTSGVSVGVPGTPMLWKDALARYGTRTLAQALTPAEKLADRGFVVDATFRNQTLDNKARFATFPATAALYLPGGDAPAVGTVFRNPELAATYRMLGRKGVDKGFYRGALAQEIADVVQHPRKSSTTTLPVPAGSMTTTDLARYRTTSGHGTTSSYRGYTVHGMDGSSSGGTTVGEALSILDTFDLSSMTRVQAEHHYLAPTALSFADRATYVGDPAYVDVPAKELLSKQYAAQRACLIGDTALATPRRRPGSASSAACAKTTAQQAKPDTENVETTNLTVADRWGNVVEYTLTIEQTGGSGQLVPGRGFLLNNELTDFTAAYDPADPNRIEPGKRPRSSISPTILTDASGRPAYALGSPGGSTIITTVLQNIVNHVDLGMTVPEAIAAPRASLRNTASVTAEPDYITQYGSDLTALGYKLTPSGDAFTSQAEIGAATAIEFGRGGNLLAAAEPTRRGGGAAAVVHPLFR